MVKALWYKDKEKNEKEAYLAHLKTLPELNTLREALEDAVTAVRKNRLSSEAYTAAWTYKQAALNGEEKALLNVISILDFK